MDTRVAIATIIETDTTVDAPLTRTHVETLLATSRRLGRILFFQEGEELDARSSNEMLEAVVRAVLHRIPLPPLYAFDDPQTGHLTVAISPFASVIERLLRDLASMPESAPHTRMRARLEDTALTIHVVSAKGCPTVLASELTAPFRM